MAGVTPVRIDVRDLRRQVGREMTCDLVQNQEPLTCYGHTVTFAEPVAVHVHLTALKSGVLARLELRGEGVIPCDRCLRPVIWPFRIEYVEQHCPPGADVDPAEEGAELRTLAEEGRAIDLDEGIRENLLLALPSKVLCRGDCRGFCPRCGRDLNVAACDCREDEVDPRLEGLRTLVEGGRATRGDGPREDKAR
ncbi:MAG: DUF177 domain-containing protein [Clostridia bacterium]|nr:DUF177 domain-containing protein [Clostridia bacterium]